MPPPTPRATETPTLTGILLVLFVMVAPLVAAGWLLYDPYGWFDGIRVNKAGGLILMVAFGIILAIFYFIAFLIYGAVSSVLEYLGVALSRPAAAPAAAALRGAPAPPSAQAGLGTATRSRAPTACISNRARAWCARSSPSPRRARAAASRSTAAAGSPIATWPSNRPGRKTEE